MILTLCFIALGAHPYISAAQLCEGTAPSAKSVLNVLDTRIEDDKWRDVEIEEVLGGKKGGKHKRDKVEGGVIPVPVSLPFYLITELLRNGRAMYYIGRYLLRLIYLFFISTYLQEMLFSG